MDTQNYGLEKVYNSIKMAIAVIDVRFLGCSLSSVWGIVKLSLVQIFDMDEISSKFPHGTSPGRFRIAWQISKVLKLKISQQSQHMFLMSKSL